MVKAVEPDKIVLTHPSQLTAEFATLALLLAPPETEHNWEKIDIGLKRFQKIVRGGVCKTEANGGMADEVVRGLKDPELVKGLVRSLQTERTLLSGTSLALLLSLTRLSTLFAPLIPLYLPALLHLLNRPNKLYFTRASSTLTGLVQRTGLSEVLRFVVREWKGEGGKGKGYREGAVKLVGGMVGGEELPVAGKGKVAAKTDDGEWKGAVEKEQMDKRVEDLEWIIKTAARDKEPSVRAGARVVWEVYRAFWPERLALFMNPMTPVTKRYLNISATAPAAPNFGASTSTSTAPISRTTIKRVVKPPPPVAPIVPSIPVVAPKSKLSASTSALPPHRPTAHAPPLHASTSTAPPRSLSSSLSSSSLRPAVSSTNASLSKSAGAHPHPLPSAVVPGSGFKPSTSSSSLVSASRAARAAMPVVLGVGEEPPARKRAGRMVLPIPPPVPTTTVPTGSTGTAGAIKGGFKPKPAASGTAPMSGFRAVGAGAVGSGLAGSGVAGVLKRKTVSASSSSHSINELPLTAPIPMDLPPRSSPSPPVLLEEIIAVEAPPAADMSLERRLSDLVKLTTLPISSPSPSPSLTPIVRQSNILDEYGFEESVVLGGVPSFGHLLGTAKKDGKLVELELEGNSVLDGFGESPIARKAVMVEEKPVVPVRIEEPIVEEEPTIEEHPTSDSIVLVDTFSTSSTIERPMDLGNEGSLISLEAVDLLTSTPGVRRTLVSSPIVHPPISSTPRLPLSTPVSPLTSAILSNPPILSPSPLPSPPSLPVASPTPLPPSPTRFEPIHRPSTPPFAILIPLPPSPPSQIWAQLSTLAPEPFQTISMYVESPLRTLSGIGLVRLGGKVVEEEEEGRFLEDEAEGTGGTYDDSSDEEHGEEEFEAPLNDLEDEEEEEEEEEEEMGSVDEYAATVLIERYHVVGGRERVVSVEEEVEEEEEVEMGGEGLKFHDSDAEDEVVVPLVQPREETEVREEEDEPVLLSRSLRSRVVESKTPSKTPRKTPRKALGGERDVLGDIQI